MKDYIYCGTEPPVGADGTQQLLEEPFNAIWCPPQHLRIAPAANERVWLVWRAPPAAQPILLGGGRFLVTDEGNFLWTNRTLGGVRPAAEAAGYRGPTNMAFLHLGNVVISADRPVVNLAGINNGLSMANAQQVQLLSQMLNIP